MTSEIAILNRSSVALASDSAVTIRESGDSKVYNSVNKLFTLSKYHPVGIMVYGSSGIMGVPWETLIKIYRRQLGRRRFPRLKEYVADFLVYLTGPSCPHLGPALQDGFVKSTLESFFQAVRKDLDKAVETRRQVLGGTIDQGEVDLAIDAAIKQLHAQVLSKAVRLPGFDDAAATQFDAKYGPLVAQTRDANASGIALTDPQKGALAEIGRELFLRDTFTPAQTGLVFAGFGEDEIFPVLESYTVDGIVLAKLRAKRDVGRCADTATQASGVYPFAQSEDSETFILGMDPQLRRMVDGVIDGYLADLPGQLLGLVPDLTATQRTAAEQQLRVLAPNLVQGVRNQIGQYQLKKHIEPMRRVLASLPKDEMAEMAEAMVQLSSIKRRFSMTIESVGGPIDVAVISKGDGFVWIKRKHYFDPSLNPHFKENYFLDLLEETP